MAIAPQASPDSAAEYTFRWTERIAEVPKAVWDVLAQPLKTPFFEWDWLHNLERSGSVGPKTGWQPLHLTVWRGERLVAAAPLYVKGHSYGEFVFDHQWAELADRFGLNYYPKLLGMSPFTPAVGYRFLMDPAEDERALTQAMVSVIDQFCDRNHILGCNFLYVDPDWRPLLEDCGFTPWMHHNSVWHNRNFAAYDDYLKLFNANQRRNIKREMQAITKGGLEMRTFSGEEITPRLLNLMYRFYSNHCDKFGYWGSKYLSRPFFERLYETSRHRLLLAAAVPLGAEDSDPVGMSFCVYKGDRLYGRYWGSFREIDCLHFNACYYTPIQWAIDNGIQIFDPGAGGSHKKRRGFPATAHYSLHRFYHPQFGKVLGNYLQQVNVMELEQIEAINNDLPFNQAEVKLTVEEFI